LSTQWISWTNASERFFPSHNPVLWEIVSEMLTYLEEYELKRAREAYRAAGSEPSPTAAELRCHQDALEARRLLGSELL
jgi:hypothetical protein